MRLTKQETIRLLEGIEEQYLSSDDEKDALILAKRCVEQLSISQFNNVVFLHEMDR